MAANNRVCYIAVITSTSEIVACGSCNDIETLQAHEAPEDCEFFEFVGGARGQYFVDGAMQSEAPSS